MEKSKNSTRFDNGAYGFRTKGKKWEVLFLNDMARLGYNGMLLELKKACKGQGHWCRVKRAKHEGVEAEADAGPSTSKKAKTKATTPTAKATPTRSSRRTATTPVAATAAEAVAAGISAASTADEAPSSTTRTDKQESSDGEDDEEEEDEEDDSEDNGEGESKGQVGRSAGCKYDWCQFKTTQIHADGYCDVHHNSLTKPRAMSLKVWLVALAEVLDIATTKEL